MLRQWIRFLEYAFYRNCTKFLLGINNKFVRGYCNLCNRPVIFCQSAGNVNPFTITNSIIGMGLRKRVVCPYCYSIDRYRWLFWVLNREKKVVLGKVLHFAPEASISIRLRHLPNVIEYITGDIRTGAADQVIDITNIPFEDGYFDCIIVSMVLEHITDEGKAINELKRVCKKDGSIIITVPIARNLTHTQEEQEEVAMSREDKIRLYGQDDHVRIYGQDVIKRFEDYGLQLIVYQPNDILDNDEIEKMKLISDDTVFICKKKVF